MKTCGRRRHAGDLQTEREREKEWSVRTRQKFCEHFVVSAPAVSTEAMSFLMKLTNMFLDLSKRMRWDHTIILVTSSDGCADLATAVVHEVPKQVSRLSN